ncbi:hypothetical protein O9X99_02265 [Agrobacterium salinitolerans]|uniref:hypothetical protein n=1 Tax=Agrobacterium TaxID=357 RepID=UPI001375AA18|nr:MULTISPECIES: hypothetical protein [Agrobacterium]MCZ7890490.1 hypothetical protein [Agrobacterium salinitolerans]
MLRVDPHPAIQRLRLSDDGSLAMWADDQTISKLSHRAGHIAVDVDGDPWRGLLAVSIVFTRPTGLNETAARLVWRESPRFAYEADIPKKFEVLRDGRPISALLACPYGSVKSGKGHHEKIRCRDMPCSFLHVDCDRRHG